jgi:hypothetical protein
MKQTRNNTRHKCRRPYCPNHYTDVIGDCWPQSGAECIPCLYAIQMVSQGTTPEQVEAVPELLENFISLLEKTGWSWQHVKDSYSRIAMLPSDVQEIQLMM